MWPVLFFSFILYARHRALVHSCVQIEVQRPVNETCTSDYVEAKCSATGLAGLIQWTFEWNVNGDSVVNASSSLIQINSSHSYSVIKIKGVKLLHENNSKLILTCTMKRFLYFFSWQVPILICEDRSHELPPRDIIFEYDNSGPVYEPTLRFFPTLNECAVLPLMVSCYVPGNSGPWWFEWFIGCRKPTKISRNQFYSNGAYAEITILNPYKLLPNYTMCLECIVPWNNTYKRVYKQITLCKTNFNTRVIQLSSRKQ